MACPRRERPDFGEIDRVAPHPHRPHGRTDATFTGSVEICIDYSAVSYGNEENLTLRHFVGGAWVPVPTTIDTLNDVICGSVTSLSPFAVFEAIDSDSIAETRLRTLAVTISALALSSIDAPNENTARERRAALANLAILSADHVAADRYGSALSVLNSLARFIDGSAPDWVLAGTARDDLVRRIATIRSLLVSL